ncbi:MAG: hypothetical protein SCM11_08320 [Bacillota bacterium]|nr:hypothetical protein [Bacillota bacterium]
MEGVLVHVLRRVNDFNRSVLEVLTAMRDQFGFYTGCLNLYDALRAVKAPVCFPELDAAPGTFLLHQLSDVFLALKQGKMPVTNDVNLNGIRLCLIMGSNQGGKTTFLRSVGIAQIMAQSGLFVAAMDCHTSIYPVILTHFPGSEDSMLKAGLLEQELTALADRIDHLQQGSLLLLNETFATTTVGEGSILAEEVTRALRDAGVISLFVTHLYPFARRLYEARGSNPDVAFLRAERLNDGLRTYRLRQGEPLATSYGYDLYDHQLSDLFN